MEENVSVEYKQYKVMRENCLTATSDKMVKNVLMLSMGWYSFYKGTLSMHISTSEVHIATKDFIGVLQKYILIPHLYIYVPKCVIGTDFLNNPLKVFTVV